MQAPRDVPFETADSKRRACPICGKPAVETSAPFCSKRCADVDLHRWLGGVYAVPDDDPGGSEPAPEDET